MFHDLKISSSDYEHLPAKEIFCWSKEGRSTAPIIGTVESVCGDTCILEVSKKPSQIIELDLTHYIFLLGKTVAIAVMKNLENPTYIQTYIGKNSTTEDSVIFNTRIVPFLEAQCEEKRTQISQKNTGIHIATLQTCWG